MKYKVAVARLAVGGQHRVEVGTWLIEVVSVCGTDDIKDQIDDVIHFPVQIVPTDCARNKAVQIATERQVDILFMVDDDSSPPYGWFKDAFQFLSGHHGSAVIGCPYVCNGTNENVQVFHFASPNNDVQKSFKLTQIPREHAARMEGIQPCASIGTHCIAYRMDAFTKIKKPYYMYGYDADHTCAIETEEMYCHRQMWSVGVPFYCDWNHWASHWKVKELTRPYALGLEDISSAYIEQAKAELTTKKPATKK